MELTLILLAIATLGGAIGCAKTWSERFGWSAFMLLAALKLLPYFSGT